MVLWPSFASLYQSPRPSPRPFVRAETNQNETASFDASISPSSLSQSSVIVIQRLSTESIGEDCTSEDNAMSHFTGTEEVVDSFRGPGKANRGDTHSVNAISTSDSFSLDRHKNQENVVANEEEDAGCLGHTRSEDEGETTSTGVIDLTGENDDDFASACSVEQESYAGLEVSMSCEQIFHDTIQQQQHVSKRPPIEISIEKVFEIAPSDCDGNGSITSGRSTESHIEDSTASTLTEAVDHDSYLNQRIARQFNRGLFFGTVVSYTHGLWHILYDDDDEQDMNFEELNQARNLYQAESGIHEKQSLDQPKAQKLPMEVARLLDTNKNGLLAFAPQTLLTRDGGVDIKGTQWECSACSNINFFATVCDCGRRKKSVRVTADNLSSIKMLEWGVATGSNADYGHVLKEPEFYLRDKENRSAFKSRYRLFVCQVFISIDAYRRKGSAFGRPYWMVGHPEENEPGSGYYKIRLEQEFTKEFFRDLAPPGFQLKTKASELGILFVNTKSGCCDTHYDDPSLFLAVLSESKKLYLGHPNVQKILTRDKTRHRYFKENPFENNTGWTEQLEVRPGDGVIIPSKWLHSIWSEAGTVALSVKIDRIQKDGGKKPIGKKKGHDLELVAEDYGNVVPCDDDYSESELERMSEQSADDAEPPADLVPEIACDDGYSDSELENVSEQSEDVAESNAGLESEKKDSVNLRAITCKKRRHNSVEECSDFICKRSFLATPGKRKKLNESHAEETPSRRLSRKVTKCLCTCGCSKTFSDVTQMWMLCTDVKPERAQKHLPRHLICSECWPVGPDSNNGPFPPPPEGAEKEDIYRIGSKHEYFVFERNYQRHLSKQNATPDSPIQILSGILFV